MNPEDQAKLDGILRKEVRALTPNDIAILKGRRNYLTEDQKETYKEVLEVPKPKEKRLRKKK